MAQINWLLIALAMSLKVLGWWLIAVRWQRIFAPRPTPRTAHFFWALLVTQLANTILPGKVGILARILLIGGSMGRTATLCTVVLEKALEALTVLVAFLLVMPFLGNMEWLGAQGLVSAALLVSILVLTFLAVKQRQNLLRWCQRRQCGPMLVAPLVTALDTLEVTGRPWALLELLGWSALIWVVTTLQAYVLLVAVGIVVPWTVVWVLNVAVQFGMRVPSLPANIGVFHYAAVLVLTMYGVSENAAVSYAFVLHVLTFLVPSLIALGYLWRTGYDWRSWRQIDRANIHGLGE